MKDHEHYPMITIERGEGAYLIDVDGNRYLDAISSWWVNLFGHANPKINAAVQAQLEKLEHVIFGGFTHPAAVTLAEKLVQLTEHRYNKIFLGDNGSSAVEIALKMSLQYWQQVGRPEKQTFINLANGYHGETIGALSVGDVSLYKDTYQPLLFEVITAPSPDCFYRQPGQSWQEYSLLQAEKLRAILEANHHRVAAIILEPLVQCAGNMRMYHPVYLQKVRDLCDEYDIHFIADEIAVGFGRTGKLFGCDHAKVTPDFTCISKGLTGGYLPLSAVLTHDSIYDAFYDEYATLKAFLHSHSYTGNPLACAAANAVCDIFLQDNVLHNNEEKIQALSRVGQKLAQHPNVGDVRQTGMILAAEMMADPDNRIEYPWQERRGMRVYEYGLSQGALLRPLANVVYFMPPYVTTVEEIEWLGEVALEGIERATKD